jgi:hypothetical protein
VATLLGVGAGLLGAVIGAAATLMSARLTQQATRDRESEFKVWERHIDAIEAAVRHTRDWERRRVNALRSGELDEALIRGPLPEEALRVEAKLTLFGSPELLDAHNASFEALKGWSLAVRTYQLCNEMGRPEDRTDANLRRLWTEAEQRAEEAERVDKVFIEKLREAALLVPKRGRR